MTTGSPPPQREGFFVALLKTGARTFVVTAVIATVLGIGAFIGLVTLIALLAGGGSSTGPTIELGRNVSATFVEGNPRSDNVILSVPVSGLILGSANDAGGGFGTDVTYGYEVKRWLELAADDDSIDAVMLEVTSPGGTIYGSRAISSGVAAYRKATKRPIWTFVEGLAASGGMWAATSTDRIVADYGSAVGSIGVIYGPFSYYDKPIAVDGGLLAGGIVTQNGIEERYFTAGRGKDAGNPFRRLTPEEVAVAQQSVDDDYRQFVEHVAKTRDIPPATITEQIGAFLYGNDQAIARKLIDATADRQAAYDELATKSGGDDYAVYRIDVPEPGLASILGVRIPDVGNRSEDSGATPSAAIEGCRLSRVVLAYGGDLAQLCPSNGPGD